MADKTWILVAHRAGARIYENAGAGTGLKLVREMDHPAGRNKNQDINADRAGRAFDSHGEGRHAMGKHESPMEHEDANFARELAKTLDHGRSTNAFRHLVLVAGARQLGLIRDSIDKNTAAMVSASLDVDLANATDAEVASRLSGTVTL